MIEILKLLNELGIKIANKWSVRGKYDNKIHNYCSFKHKKIEYAVSTSGISYIFSKLEKGKWMLTYVYEGYSFEELEKAIRKEVGDERIQDKR